MDIYKSVKISTGTVARNREMLKFVPDHLKYACRYLGKFNFCSFISNVCVSVWSISIISFKNFMFIHKFWFHSKMLYSFKNLFSFKNFLFIQYLFISYIKGWKNSHVIVCFQPTKIGERWRTCLIVHILKRGTSWNELELPGTSWNNKLELSETNWNHLEQGETTWSE